MIGSRTARTDRPPHVTASAAHPDDAPRVDSGRGLAAIFLLSLGVLLLEIALTRIFSFSLWYHFIYVALSVGLLGYGASGAVLAVSERLAAEPPARLVTGSMLAAALGVLISFFTIAFVPLDPLAIRSSPFQLVLLTVLFVLCSSPFFAAGMAMAAAFRAAATPNRLYFADLVGAGFGCALSVSAIWILGAPGAATAAAAFFAVASVIAAPLASRARHLGIGAAIVIACAAFAALVPFRPSGEKLLAQVMRGGIEPIYSRWSPIFRVDLYQTPLEGRKASQRGVSPHFQGKTPRINFIAHDGGAEAPMYEFSGGAAELEFLRQNVAALPYLVSERPRVLVIGLGGGFDVLNALTHDASAVVGVELDPITIDLVREYASFNGDILSDERVSVVAAEGRSFLRHSQDRYDIVQLTGVDTLSALSTGAYMLAESYLYTVDAFAEYLEHLSDGGTLSIMTADRHWKGGGARFSLRHVMNFIAAAEQLGIEDVGAHVAIVATPAEVPELVLLFRREAFRPEETQALRSFAEAKGFEVWHLPDSPPTTPHTQLLRSGPGEREALLRSYALNVAATPDDRPFFFHYYRWRDLLSGRWEVDVGHTLATGQLVLVAILVVAILTSVGLILGPLWMTRRLRRPGALRFGTYFAAIGLGFMLIEISMIQRSILFLGHPTYSIAVILMSLLTWTGLGSDLAGRLRIDERTLVRAALLVLLGLIACYAWGVPLLFARWLGAAPAVRYLLIVIVLMPLGLTLGVFFPTGLRVARAHTDAFVPWAWGANGAASVVGSILAIVLAISFGFRAVLLLAALVYLVGVAVLPGAPVTRGASS